MLNNNIFSCFFSEGFASPEGPGPSLSGGARARPMWAHIGTIFCLWAHMGPGHVRIRPATVSILLMIPFLEYICGRHKKHCGPLWALALEPSRAVCRCRQWAAGEQGFKGFKLCQRTQPWSTVSTFASGSNLCQRVQIFKIS